MREALAAIAAALAELEADWYLFGAQAAILHGSSRLSDDIDVTVWVDDRDRLLRALSAHDLSIDEDDDDFVQRTRVLAVTHEPSGWSIDIVFAAPGFEDHVLSRTRWVELGGLRFRVPSPEDVVVMKCLAGRDTDRQDVVAILAAQDGRIDLDYVRDLLEQLREALSEDEIVRFFDGALADARRATRR
jgi:hypothetical protein